MRKEDESGFAVIEGFLLIVIIAILGFTGWFVYHSKQVTDKTLNATNNNNLPQQTTKKTTTLASTPTTSQGYVTITKWGIKAPYSGNLHITYSISGNEASISSNELSALDQTCQGFGGTINRYQAGVVAEMPFLAGNYTPEQFIAANPQTTYAKVGDYYYLYVHPTSACGSNPDTTSVVQEQTVNAIKTIMPKFEATT